MTDQQAARHTVRVYYTANGLFTVAASLIWGVNTLFLMRAGLDILGVMAVNAAFTVGQLVCEVPTGVVADTVGRKVSFVVGTVTLAVATVLYVIAEQMHLGIGWFIGASLLIGLGFTFQTGSTDAWLVDALDHVGYSGSMERVFARGGMIFGGAMLVGTISGGFLGQLDLAYPYYLRAVVLVVASVYAIFVMHDIGFAPRPLVWNRFGAETRAIFDVGIKFGWRNATVRPLMFASLAQGLFFIFGFYSWQRYFLDLLGREAVWVTGVVSAGFALAGIAGNALVGRIQRNLVRRGRTGRLLGIVALAQAVLAAAVGLVGVLWPAARPGVTPFMIVVTLYLAFGLMQGLAAPVRQALINRHIPSAQRATVLSVDSFFGDVGGSGGQLGLGWLSKTISIPVAWIVGGAILLGAVPAYRSAENADASAENPS